MDELEFLLLMESKIAPQEVTIDLSPLYHDAIEDIAHDNFFQWRRDDGQAIAFDSTHKNTVVTFVRTHQFYGTVNTYKWTNPIPVDLSGLPSLYRILIIRDITKRLRQLDEQKEEDNKMLTGDGETTINFKLEDTKFSLQLAPKPMQQGNALLTMQGSEGSLYKYSHRSVEKFDCFAKLDPKEIDSIVSSARRAGKPINDTDINIDEDDRIKKKLAEEMTFFMLLYDFEVARRLQGQLDDYSSDLDWLPIGIGIAMIHRINSQIKKKRWIFFSGLFVGDWESRNSALDEIDALFKELNGSTTSWTKGHQINLLEKQFGAVHPVTT